MGLCHHIVVKRSLCHIAVTIGAGKQCCRTNNSEVKRVATIWTMGKRQKTEKVLQLWKTWLSTGRLLGYFTFCLEYASKWIIYFSFSLCTCCEITYCLTLSINNVLNNIICNLFKKNRLYESYEYVWICVCCITVVELVKNRYISV